MYKYILYFLVSGAVITGSILLAEIGQPFLGGLLLVLPNMSIIAFYFINVAAGKSSALVAAKSSLLGTIIVWPIYMLLLLYLIPKIGVNKALLYGVMCSIVLAIIFVFFCKIPSVNAWINS